MLTVEAIGAHGPGPWGRSLTVVPSTGSTNDDLLREARRGAPHGTVLIAEHQTAGKGRLGRSWQSPAGVNLYLSVLLRPPRRPRLVGLPTLALVAGLAVSEALDELGVADSRLKWPNDLLLGGRKLAGVLCEALPPPDMALVVGVGLNVNQRSFPPRLEGRATSLGLVRGAAFDRAEVAASLVRNLHRRLSMALTGPLDGLLEAWCERSDTLGKWVRTQQGPEGLAVAVDRDGALIVETSDGRRHRVFSGLVTHASDRATDAGS